MSQLLMSSALLLAPLPNGRNPLRVVQVWPGNAYMLERDDVFSTQLARRTVGDGRCPELIRCPNIRGLGQQFLHEASAMFVIVWRAHSDSRKPMVPKPG